MPSLETSFLCKYKPHLPEIHFGILHRNPSGTHLWILNLKALRDSNCVILFGTKLHIFGPRKDTNSVPCQTEFVLLF